MMDARQSLIFGFAGMLTAVLAGAQVPRVLDYQGRLADSTGAAVADGQYSVTFQIYDVAESGSPLWIDTQSVTTKRGPSPRRWAAIRTTRWTLRSTGRTGWA
jgi:hypothetical protein